MLNLGQLFAGVGVEIVDAKIVMHVAGHNCDGERIDD